MLQSFCWQIARHEIDMGMGGGCQQFFPYLFSLFEIVLHPQVPRNRTSGKKSEKSVPPTTVCLKAAPPKRSGNTKASKTARP